MSFVSSIPNQNWFKVSISKQSKEIIAKPLNVSFSIASIRDKNLPSILSFKIAIAFVQSVVLALTGKLDSRFQSFEVLTYVANSSTIDESVMPFDWYKALVLLGALENKFPELYINLLRKIEVIFDNKFERSDENWGIIKSSLLSN